MPGTMEGLARFTALGLILWLGCTGTLESDHRTTTPDPDSGVDDACSQIRCPPTSVCLAGACVSRDPCLGIECPPDFVCSAAMRAGGHSPSRW